MRVDRQIVLYLIGLCGFMGLYLFIKYNHFGDVFIFLCLVGIFFYLRDQFRKGGKNERR